MVSVTPRLPDASKTITISSYFMSAGGKGANQAIACGRTSQAQSSATDNKTLINVKILGAVGRLDGHFNTLLKPTLEKSGVNTSWVQIIPDAYTGIAVIVIDSGLEAENRILFLPGANYKGMQLTPKILGLPVPDVIIMQGEIPVGSIIAALQEITTFKSKSHADGMAGIKAGPDVMFNPAPTPPGGLPEDTYAAVDHLIMNKTEADLMTPPTEQLLKVVPDAASLDKKDKVARYFHQLGVTYVIITLGSKGSWYSATDAKTSSPADGVNRFTNHIPADKVSKVLDTTAAGDTFVGAYAVEVARWREARRTAGNAGMEVTTEQKPERYQKVTEEAMKLATRAAARCVERQGSMDSIPWEDEL